MNRILGEAVNKCVRECKFKDDDDDDEEVRACVLINAVLDKIAQDQLNETDLNTLRDDTQKLHELCKGVYRDKIGRRRKIIKRNFIYSIILKNMPMTVSGKLVFFIELIPIITFLKEKCLFGWVARIPSIQPTTRLKFPE